MRNPNKFDMPELENQLKEMRIHGFDALNGILPEHNEVEFKDSCVSDANYCELVDSLEKYEELNVKPNNGWTLIRAHYDPCKISSHYHLHKESIMIEDGKLSVHLGGAKIDLSPGGQITIPAKELHRCQFFSPTKAIVCLPTAFVKKNLASLVS